MIAWAQVEAVVELLTKVERGLTREQIASKWEIEIPLVEAFGEGADGWTAQRRATLVLLGVMLPNAPLREVMIASLEDPRGRAFLGVHEADGVVWLAKEPFEELAQLVADREAVLGIASVALSEREVDDVAELAAKEGYRAEAIAKALGRDVKLPPRSEGAVLKRPSS